MNLTVRVRTGTGAERSTFAVCSPTGTRSGRMQVSRDRRRELGEEVTGQTVMESPSNRDRAVAFGYVGLVRRRTKAPERSISGTQTSEENDVSTLFRLTNVTPPVSLASEVTDWLSQ